MMPGPLSSWVTADVNIAHSGSRLQQIESACAASGTGMVSADLDVTLFPAFEQEASASAAARQSMMVLVCIFQISVE